MSKSPITGYGITSDDQLRKLATKMGIHLNYIGFAEDLPSKLAPIGFNIINLGDRKIGGTHWVLWYVDPDHRFSVYADSYGAPPEDQIMKVSPMPIIINGKQVQRYTEEYCGIWALTAAAFINKSKDKKNALVEFMNRYKAV